MEFVYPIFLRDAHVFLVWAVQLGFYVYAEFVGIVGVMATPLLANRFCLGRLGLFGRYLILNRIFVNRVSRSGVSRSAAIEACWLVAG